MTTAGPETAACEAISEAVGAGHGGGEERDYELRRVVEEEHDDVASPDSEAGVEAGGQFPGGELNFRVGEGFSGGGVDEGRAGRVAVEVLEDVRVDGKVVRYGDGR
ncbi:Phox-associated domain [Striga asiatica]|uniref:Phox-associated domain n=1 Tax=Striga asiatica TaxID=4170 RepID=A0A5A7R5C5_STRAF|nr:Phox-associated domain [Striga asiatica]